MQDLIIFIKYLLFTLARLGTLLSEHGEGYLHFENEHGEGSFRRLFRLTSLSRYLSGMITSMHLPANNSLMNEPLDGGPTNSGPWH
jgi:hypothetical protein